MQLKPSFTEGHVGRTLFVKTLPMVGGILALVAYNLADTIFVSRLDEGTGESHYLAAMGFIFPVVMLIISVSLGLGTGVSSVISRTIGQGDFARVRRLTTHSLILALLVVIVFATLGLVTIDPVFRMLGAQPHMLPVIKQYMNIWYVGVVFIVIPMVGNNAIRAAGDMKLPGLIMCVGSGLNILLDPIMIFGWWGFPKMGIAGAALATVISRAVGTVLSLWVLHHRKKMLEVSRKVFHHMLESWGHIAYVAVPAAATTILFPVSLSVLTRLAADIGSPVVAAVGAGNRILAFAMIPIWALGSTLGPFVGQNWGAKNFVRAQTAANLSCGFCIVWGLFCTVVFAATAKPLASLFSERGKVWSKISRQIIVAAKSGGGDPDANLALRYAIDEARAANMPKDTIKNAIKKGTGDLDGVSYEDVIYEGYGPGGVAFMVSTLTDNRNRTAPEMRKLFEKGGGQLGASNCVAYMFEQKGTFVIATDQTDEDVLMEIAIEAGADDVTTEGKFFEISCDPSAFPAVKEALGEKNIETMSAELAMVPSNTITPDEAQARKLLNFMETLEDNDDVQKVYTNFDVPESLMNEIG